MTDGLDGYVFRRKFGHLIPRSFGRTGDEDCPHRPGPDRGRELD
ncbi:MAG: hypothetical protein AB1641_14630 [Thermodesulfobacteriota bacterium]